MALTDKLTAIANAIREKTGGTELLTLDQMPTEIAGIETGGGGGAIIEYGSYTPAENTDYFKCSSGRMAETHTFPAFLIVRNAHGKTYVYEKPANVKDAHVMIWEKVSVSESDSPGGYKVQYKACGAGYVRNFSSVILQYNESEIYRYDDGWFGGAENMRHLVPEMQYLAGNTYNWIAIW